MADGDEVTIWSLKYWQTDGIASVKCEEIHDSDGVWYREVRPHGTLFFKRGKDYALTEDEAAAALKVLYKKRVASISRMMKKAGVAYNTALTVLDRSRQPSKRGE